MKQPYTAPQLYCDEYVVDTMIASSGRTDLPTIDGTDNTPPILPIIPDLDIDIPDV